MSAEHLNEERPTHPRGYRVFRPRWEERPTNLLSCQFEKEVELDWVRVAKHKNVVVAAYKIAMLNSNVYKISSLAVDERYRGCGLGSWLLLHALGLIESKGGQTVHANWGCRSSLLQRIGFEQVQGSQYRLKLERE